MSIIYARMSKVLFLFIHQNHSYKVQKEVQVTKAKTKWDYAKVKKLLHSEGNYKQGEKTAFRMGENNIK